MNTVKERKKSEIRKVVRRGPVKKLAGRRAGVFLDAGDVAAPGEGVFKKVEVAKREYVMVPENAYREMFEDMLDSHALVRSAADIDDTIPGDVVDRLMSGDSPIKVYREWRGLTQEALAKEVESDKVYISQIETGRRKASLDLTRRLARALGVDIDDLVSDAAGA